MCFDAAVKVGAGEKESKFAVTSVSKIKLFKKKIILDFPAK